MDTRIGGASGRRRHATARAAGWALLALLVPGCLLGRVAFTPDGKRFAAVLVDDDTDDSKFKDKTWQLWTTDVESGAHVLVLRDGMVGPSVAWSAGGRALWFLHAEKDSKVYALAKWDGASVTDFVKVPLKDDSCTFALFPPQLVPDGSAVILSEDSDEGTATRLVRIEFSTGARTVLAEHSGGGSLSPRGDQVAFYSWDADKPGPLSLCVMPAAGGQRRILAAVRERIVDVGCTSLLWSPDGARIAWTDAPEKKAKDNESAAFVVDVAGGAPLRVSPEGDDAMSLVFSADGSSLYYGVQVASGVPCTRRAQLATGSARFAKTFQKVADVIGAEGCLPVGFSPDGRVLALRRTFAKTAKERSDVSVVRLLTLATGATRDDWVFPAQRRAQAVDEIVAAESHAAAGRTEDSAAALDRARKALAAMERDFPGSGVDARSEEIRRRIASAGTPK